MQSVQIGSQSLYTLLQQLCTYSACASRLESTLKSTKQELSVGSWRALYNDLKSLILLTSLHCCQLAVTGDQILPDMTLLFVTQTCNRELNSASNSLMLL